MPSQPIIEYLEKITKEEEKGISVFLASETDSKTVHQITSTPAPEHPSQAVNNAEIGHGHPDLSPEALEEMKTLILKYRQVFAAVDTEVHTVKDFKFKIQLTDERTISKKPYPMNPEKRRHAHKLVDDMFESGLVRITGSPYNHPVVLVKKPNADPNGDDSLSI